jgi:hypothetical protein
MLIKNFFLFGSLDPIDHQIAFVFTCDGQQDKGKSHL